MTNSELKYFTEPAILKQIGPKRIALLLRDFAEDIKASQLVLPSPEVENGDYFVQVAATFGATERLPERLLEALLTLENAASPANDKQAWMAIKRRIPCVSVSWDCALDRVLDLWFLARDECAQFALPKADEVEPAAPDRKEIQPRMDTDAHGLKTELVDDGIGPIDKPPIPADIRVHPCLSVVAPIPPPPETDEQTFNRLAALSPAQYDRTRKAEATRLGVRLETLDTEVAKSRTELDYDDQARAVKLPPVEPWPEPVDGAEVLDQVSERFTLHVFLPPGAADAITLWDAHAHAFQAFLHSPRLNLTSPEKECGKTTTLDLLATMTPRALRTEDLTAPVLFRVVDQHQPTLLLDEVDAYLTRSEELRGLLNAGHKQGACAYRCAGGGNAIRAFKAFGPAVLSGIGPLPDTLHDRSIRILLTKAEPGQLAARFDSRKKDIETVLCRKLARWTQDNFALLQACDPPMPATAYNRVADNWRPLFAIAQIAGGDWPRRALEAYTHLTNQRAPENSQLKTLNPELLLADIRQIYTQAGTTRLSCKQILNCLRALDRPWSQPPACNAPLTSRWLGQYLHRLGIRSHSLRIGHQSVRGYELADFSDAFARFLKA